MRVNWLTSLKTIYPLPRDAPSGLTIECLSPTGRQTERYETAILDCIGPDEKIAKALEHSEHNDVSVVLKITYGDSTVILGGDLEDEGWKEVVEEYGEANLKASAVKVSHHGSENGYCDRLWEHFAAAGKPIAVIAPAHRYKLPKPAALTLISSHADTIVATCQPRLDWAVPRLSGRTGPPLESRIAMRTHLSAMHLADGSPCGQCSLQLDNKGNVKVELTKPAIQLSGGLI